MGVGGRVGHEHARDALETGGGLGGGGDVMAGDQNIHGRAERAGGGQRLGDGVAQLALRDIGQKKGLHHSTPASFFSLPTSSATEPTFAPPLRAGGSLVLRTVSRGVTSTPKSAGVFSSMGFFLAFMMLGREA